MVVSQIESNLERTFHKSKWVDFLRQYGPIPRNDNMYDEVIQRNLKTKKIEPIIFETEYLDELINNFKSTSPKSVILTGTAGDGKTFCCREVWEALGGAREIWEQDITIRQLNLDNHKLYIVKDLSELNNEDKIRILTLMADSIINFSSDQIYLIAANDGQLIEAWEQAENTDNVIKVRKIIEELLVNDQQEDLNYNLRFYNLSRLNTARMFTKILDAVINHSGWQECQKCYYHNPPNLNEKCPIWENKKRLEEKHWNNILRERIIDLLQLVELNGIHLPIRQLLLLISNMLLGHPEGKDKLLNCKIVPFIVDNDKSYLSSIYHNIFGFNLSERKINSIEVFKVLNSFGIGKETSNQIDNILIFGKDDPEISHYYHKFLKNDSFYGTSKNFIIGQKSYLEGDLIEEKNNFLKILISQRQRLFFIIAKDEEENLNFWNLTIFQFAGEYLNKVYKKLKNNEKVSQNIIGRLAKGINRIFTGMLVNNFNEIIIATSGSYSQAKISQVYEESIPVRKNRGEEVTIELEENHNIPTLIVYLSVIQNDIYPIKLTLNLARYEYLSRVAEGTLPSSFSQEYYEDILAFKTQILQKVKLRKKWEGEELETDNSLLINLLEMKDDGKAHPINMEVMICR
ncbi:hypothetical protein VKI21_01890 [Cyanobacterium aponinum UTEX 3222]|uniref:Uncharacterized protein n=1 Tax=Cyanobacterium aponinum (strain PCC 10605) TaxID=755178 RepID=K9ZA44_CYAAP|nr:hypothetical protein [Cyanobacterium aponinum]AFZ55465.1 hypothetical protein Cyan10605_3425 [Cyanobacterium aponinum PCC 10605]PHV63307.1 hypothetical protein CSQ80_06100 [Cyanobacterium aponinum IPPAS B-1201]WRL39676.1 hypothetical protein VKI22_06220 [Cyanobacterium aponinum UTEX 3221]WRL42458.1 hypothetical protein VKI21_01890 [Cyanobacterium aponinum UTEX 3222]